MQTNNNDSFHSYSKPHLIHIQSWSHQKRTIYDAFASAFITFVFYGNTIFRMTTKVIEICRMLPYPLKIVNWLTRKQQQTAWSRMGNAFCIEIKIWTSRVNHIERTYNSKIANGLSVFGGNKSILICEINHVFLQRNLRVKAESGSQ